MTVLTRDNIQLSSLIKAHVERAETGIAINCNRSGLPTEVMTFIQESRAVSTRRAYASDLQQFMEWGGTIPATSEMIAAYIASQADKLKPATINRRLASLAVAHGAKGLPSPTSSELVKSVLKGIRRSKGIAQVQAKPLLRDDLFIVLDAMGDSLKDTRDRALLLLGFAGAFRRSELIGLDVGDIEFVRHGLVITLRHSKVDPEGRGRKIGIPHGRTKHCPVKAIEIWLQQATICEGPIFSPISRHDHKASQRLSGEAVAEVIRTRLENAGMNPVGFSGHSLRSGFATSAAMAGVASWRIRKQTGHASDAMLGKYVRDGELFSENVAGTLL